MSQLPNFIVNLWHNILSLIILWCLSTNLIPKNSYVCVGIPKLPFETMYKFQIPLIPRPGLGAKLSIKVHEEIFLLWCHTWNVFIINVHGIMGFWRHVEFNILIANLLLKLRLMRYKKSVKHWIQIKIFALVWL